LAGRYCWEAVNVCDVPVLPAGEFIDDDPVCLNWL
jgi:hypothetical protein